MVKLEHFDQQDFKQLMQWIDSEHLMTNWSGSMFKYPLTQESLEWYIEDVNDLEKSEAFVYKALDEKTGETVGHISLGGLSKKNKTGRISRVLIGNTAARGKGYCSGMINEILKIGFEKLKLHRISLGVYDFNTSAIRCYEKSGFVKEGLMRDILLQEDGTYWSLVEMSILEDEWRSLQKISA